MRIESTADKIVKGDTRSVARLIRDIDDKMPSARDTLKELYHFTGKAYVVGITGSPGVGKSTLVDQIVGHLRAHKKQVGVLAVDPTSPFSGGAILGDRIRMQRHAADEGVFIRSLATRGYFGGLTQSTRSAVNVLDAMGKQYILIETVGVGQDEVDVARTAHTTVVVVIPGMGDDIQAIKAGILEIADIFVINKDDREGADKTFNELQGMVDMAENSGRLGKWRPPIIKAQAIADKGTVELVQAIEKHKEYLAKFEDLSGFSGRRERARKELADMVKAKLIEEVFRESKGENPFEEAVDSIVEGKMDPYTACDNLVARLFDGRVVI